MTWIRDLVLDPTYLSETGQTGVISGRCVVIGDSEYDLMGPQRWHRVTSELLPRLEYHRLRRAAK